MIDTFITHTLNGLYYAAILFMISSGLTIIFGILGVLNLAHGELYALGAFLGVTILGILTSTVATPTSPGEQVLFIGIVVGGIIFTALLLMPIGAVIEAVLIRPIYGRHELYQLLLTYGILLVLVDIMKFWWGSLPIQVGAPYQGINSIGFPASIGFSYPTYNLFVIALAGIVFVCMLWFFSNTTTGRIIRATSINREMATAIGVNPARTFTLVFALGAFFAGFGGAAAIGPSNAALHMGITPLILSFVVIVIGGLGSIIGAFVASILVGVISRWSIWLYPPAELAAPFILMAIILLIKPEGLFGTWGEIE